MTSQETSNGATQHEAARTLDHWRRLWATLPSVVVEVDAEGTIQFINRAVTDQPVEAVIGLNMYNYIPPDQHPKVRAAVASVLATGEPTQYMVLSIGPQRTNVWYETRVLPLPSSANPPSVLMVTSMINDHNAIATLVAERERQQAQALAAQEVRFQALIEHSAEAIALLGAEGNVVYGSPSIERVLGYPLGEFVGSPAANLVHAEDQPQFKALFRGFMPNETIQLEARIRTYGGDWRWMEIVVTNLLTEPSVEAVVVNFRDVTERKHNEEQLRLSAEILRRVRALVIVADAQAAIISVGGATAELLGYPIEELLGYGWWKRTRPDFAATSEERAYIAQAARGEIPVDEMPYERPIQRYDGQQRWILWHDVKGPDDLLIGIGHDITERKQAEAALEEAKDLAEQANRAKSDFLSQMSHELRTPLTAILGFTQLIQFGILDTDQEDAAQRVIHAGRHLLVLINEILDLSHVESGHMEFVCEPVILPSLLTEVLSLIQPLATQRNVHIYVDPITSHDPLVLADSQRLTQVLLNLVSNAIKYNVEQGSVTLSLQSRATDRLRIMVQDTGYGIAPGALPRLFTPFDRLDIDRRGMKIEGSGLGLALSKRLIEGMGGSIGVESRLGHGSTFWIELPRVTSLNPYPSLSII